MSRKLALIAGLLLATSCGDSGPAHPYLAAGAPDQVVLVTVGSLRPDHLRSYSYEPRKEQVGVLGRDLSSYWTDMILGDATPTPGDEPTEGDSRAGLVFDNAQSSSSDTGPGLASIFTGLVPSKHGVLATGETLDESMTTLAELFKEAGYETAAFMGVRHPAGLAQGFDLVKGRHTHAQTVTLDARDWLQDASKRGTQKFFLWVHYDDVRNWFASYPSRWPEYEGHAEQVKRATKGTRKAFYNYVSHLHGLEPHEVGQPFPVLKGGRHADTSGAWIDFIGEDREEVLGWVDRYDARIYRVDINVRELFKQIQDLEFPGRKLYMLTAPHGEAIGDHGYLGHARDLYEAQLRVPLLMRFSGGDRPRGHVPDLVRTTDLFPTLAVMLGRNPNDYHPALDGEPLWPLMPGAPNPDGQDPRVAYAERRPADAFRRDEMGWEPGQVWSVRTPEHKLIVREEGDDELYLMRGNHREKMNLAGREPAHPAEASLRRLLAEHLRWIEEHADEIPAAGPPGEAWLGELLKLGERPLE